MGDARRRRGKGGGGAMGGGVLGVEVLVGGFEF